MIIYWEGRSYEVKADDKGYIDFTGFCKQLGKDGRFDLLSVLAINYNEEYVKIKLMEKK
jgi:hypothetical protein